MDGDDPVAAFLAVTGATEAQAVQMLEATNYSLQDAVELFFAAGGDLGGGAPTAAAAQGLDAAGPPPLVGDEEMARRLHEAGTSEADDRGFGASPEVRAPIPTRTDRLYGDEFAAVAAAYPRRAAANPVPAVDAFRDFRAEEAAGSGAVAGGGLASLYEPPRDILFTGSFEDAKHEAAGSGRWLLVNLQSTSQFASHQLNRDTWGEATLRAVVQASFVLLQAQDVSEDGQKLANFYQVYELPCILVVDPVTGAPMRKWTGFISAERLGEELMPFLDTSFADPGAARLAASLKRKLHGPPSRRGSGELSPRLPPASQMEEDEEEAALQRALQASAAEAAQEPPPPPLAEAPAAAAAPAAEEPPSAAASAAAAAARLPPEVEGPQGCRVAVRFADGARAQRRFPRSAPLSAVHDWCLTQSEEAAGGRRFLLADAMPGAPPLSDAGATLDAAGVADSTLVMKWAD